MPPKKPPAKKPAAKKPAAKKSPAKKSPAKKPAAKKAEMNGAIAVEDEISKSFLDYAMSVIVSRALPDVKDGLHQYREEFCIRCMKQEFAQPVPLESVQR